MKAIFLAYREWALDVYNPLKKNPKLEELVLCKTHEELLSLNIEDYDLLISCGWSDELGDEVTSKIESIGVHCAELDRYSYGTPIQNQIIDGLTFSKHRVFSFTFDNESERAHTHNCLYSHEVVLDLSGNMDDILYQMTSTSIVLFNMFVNDYPNNIEWKKWPSEDIVREKRKPLDSRLTKNDLQSMNTEELYNFFRCLEAPYPNGYIEDEKGRLYIERVKYVKK
ncbi:hypothetical protein [Tenacibaculum sp. 190524A05c]|uniref:hypothetical protein n=1 Tax=Tenacibaculum platacis TaxID=3137852 RepID=UPI0032B19EB4